MVGKLCGRDLWVRVECAMKRDWLVLSLLQGQV